MAYLQTNEALKKKKKKIRADIYFNNLLNLK